MGVCIGICSILMHRKKRKPALLAMRSTFCVSHHRFCCNTYIEGGHPEGVVMGEEQMSGLVVSNYLLQVKWLSFFRSAKLLMIKQWCYKVPFRAFLIHHLNACLEMCQFVLLSKYLMRLVLNFQSSEILEGLFLYIFDPLN